MTPGRALLLLLLLALPRLAAAADPLLLEQAVEAGRSGTTHLVIDRQRISTILVEKEEGFAHRLAVTLDPDREPRLHLRCIDPATTRAMLEALRPGGPPVFQATGRCSF